MPTRTYATVSIYAPSEHALAPIRERVATPPGRTSAKGGLFGLHYSTKGRLDSEKTEEHLAQLMHELSSLPECFRAFRPKRLSSTVVPEVRLWIYFESGGANEDFSLSVELISWLQSVRGDVCVDIWRQE